MRSDIRKMISENKVCVLATVSDGEPHCSLMSYAADDDCREIYMATLKNTKKYRNLLANPRVSLLIDTRESSAQPGIVNTRALTVTGTFQDSADAKRKPVIREILLAKHPDLTAFFNDPETEIVVIRATALQLLDGITDAYFEHVS